ncbi:chemotaxis protein MotA [Streptohalobacillus salinus]|uniref:Chemotaxis protein MotA n=1 Tax=Streptohalobacillus salinus TaxID=621096 RepID=A0A2V3W1M1_9BACI|nr:flagellar motor protein MotP [Streptohalobacillus salinus]PXW88167.1 chemotaxis protein MotA [Streptohalobacillus salinus]
MKRTDILTPIGIVLGLLMIAFGILSSSGSIGGVIAFIQIPSLVIVFGGLAAAILINFNIDQVKSMGRVVKESFNKTDQDLSELISLFERLSERARREGLLALETELEEVTDPFIKKGVLLAIDGIEPEVIHDIMSAEITAMEDRHAKGRVILEKAGDYAPAWGMIGTLIGLVLMLNDLNDPTTLGPQMAVALLTTFYGAVLANLVFIPMAGKLESKTEQEVFMKQIVIEGVIGVQSGQNPRILKEKLSAFLSDDMRKRRSEDSDDSLEGAADEAS